MQFTERVGVWNLSNFSDNLMVVCENLCVYCKDEKLIIKFILDFNKERNKCDIEIVNSDEKLIYHYLKYKLLMW